MLMLPIYHHQSTWAQAQAASEASTWTRGTALSPQGSVAGLVPIAQFWLHRTRNSLQARRVSRGFKLVAATRCNSHSLMQVWATLSKHQSRHVPKRHSRWCATWWSCFPCSLRLTFSTQRASTQVTWPSAWDHRRQRRPSGKPSMSESKSTVITLPAMTWSASAWALSTHRFLRSTSYMK
jgi:hypothetical protein